MKQEKKRKKMKERVCRRREGVDERAGKEEKKKGKRNEKRENEKTEFCRGDIRRFSYQRKMNVWSESVVSCL